MVHEFDGTKYGKLRDMQAARCAKHPDLVRGGMNLAQAAHAAGVPKRTGKAWRNGRTRSTGRNERPPADRHRGGMDKPRRTDAGHLCMDERIAIADMRHAGSGVRAIARTLGRAPSTISREPRRNADGIGGAYGPNRAQQKAAHRPRRSHVYFVKLICTVSSLFLDSFVVHSGRFGLSGFLLVLFGYFISEWVFL